MADDMGRRAREALADVIYWDGALPREAPANQLADLYDASAGEEDPGYLNKPQNTYYNRWPELLGALP